MWGRFPACRRDDPLARALLGKDMRELACARTGFQAKLERHARCKWKVKAAFAQLAGVCEDLCGGSLESDVTGAHYNDAVCGERLVHEVRDVDEGGAGFLKQVKHAHDAAASANVKHGTRLIKYEHVWVHGEGARDGDALLLAAGEARRICLGICGHRHAPQLLVDAAGDVDALDAEVLWPEGHVIGDDTRDDLVLGVLEDEARDPARVTVGVRVRRTVEAGAARELDGSLVGRNQACEHLSE